MRSPAADVVPFRAVGQEAEVAIQTPGFSSKECMLLTYHAHFSRNGESSVIRFIAGSCKNSKLCLYVKILLVSFIWMWAERTRTSHTGFSSSGTQEFPGLLFKSAMTEFGRTYSLYPKIHMW